MMSCISIRLEAHMNFKVQSEQSGFSLIEIAVVLVILTVLLTGIAIPISAQVEIRRLDDTKKSIDEARTAVMGFIASNGRFPCPATAASNGLESFCTTATGGCTATTTLQTHGRCSNFYNGFLPAVSLGLSPVDSAGLLRDAWGAPQNRIRYAVRDLDLTVLNAGLDLDNALTIPDGIRTASMGKILRTSSGSSERNLISVCLDATVTTSDCNGTANTVANAPAIIFSLGSNAATTNGTSVQEAENLDGNVVFISRDRSGGTNEFDDIVTWISIYKVFDRLVEVGRLP
jgi:prepilin-type N-terminal cleavage/methylation domain-containing protein